MTTKQQELLHLSAAEVVMKIRDQQITAVDYAKAVIAQAEKWKHLNAFITFSPDQLLRDARRVDQKIERGEKVGLLAGLPFVVKDCINTADYPTTSGTPSLAGFRPRQNASAVQRLLNADAIVAGKTNLHEICYGITSNNFFTGAVRNPYDQNMIAGGSSGGTGAAVGARIGVVGLGADTGGSIRIPAAHCGVAGLRPTVGRWPSGGMLPASPTRETIGPIGRSVKDVALLDMIATGEVSVKLSSLKGVRLGVPKTSFWKDLDVETQKVADATLDKLRAAGVELIDVDMDEIMALDEKCGMVIAVFETPIAMSSYLISSDAGVTYEEVIDQVKSPDVRAVTSKTMTISREKYRAAMEDRAQMQLLYAQTWEKYGVAAVIFPTTPLPPRPIGQDQTVELNGKKVPTFPTYIRNTSPGSVAGVPGLTLPIGLTSSGLPVGLEIDSPAWHDRELLGIGLAIEKLLPRLPDPELNKE